MRKSFILHKDSLSIIEEMTDEQCGKFLKALYNYQINGEKSDVDFALKMALTPFYNQFDRDNEKYEKTCEARKKAGSKGGKQKVANASNSKQNVANLADSDSKSDNDSDNKSDSKNKEVLLGDYPLFDRLVKIHTPNARYPKYKDSKDFVKFNKLKDRITDEDLTALEEFYKVPKSKDCDLTWNRKGKLEQLLNQYSEQVDIAIQFNGKSKPTPRKFDIEERIKLVMEGNDCSRDEAKMIMGL